MRKIILRRFQDSAVFSCKNELRNKKRVLITSPPGSGKTVMLAEIAKGGMDRGNVLIVAQRRELLKQIREHLICLGVHSSNIGAVYPNSDAPLDLDRPIQICSAQTLIRRELFPPADMLIIDEAHHAVAPGHARITNNYRKSRVVGLTATPMRMDGVGLGDLFDIMIIAAYPSNLILGKMLAKPRVFTTPDEFLPNLVEVRRSLGDYVKSDLEDRVNRQKLVGNIVDNYRLHGDGKTAILFATSVKHSQSITGRFLSAGIRAEHLDSDTPTVDRDAIIGRLKSGRTKVLCNVGILAEGFDLPRTDVIILARPTLSLSLYLQQVGRGLRWYKGRKPIILDHARNVLRFGMPEADREFDLYTRTPDCPEGARVKVCKGCFAVIPMGTRTCPECGFELIRPITEPQEIDVDLAEFDEQSRMMLRQRLDVYLRQEGVKDNDLIERSLEVWSAANSLQVP